MEELFNRILKVYWPKIQATGKVLDASREELAAIGEEQAALLYRMYQVFSVARSEIMRPRNLRGTVIPSDVVEEAKEFARQMEKENHAEHHDN
jgi:hypothetical protein